MSKTVTRTSIEYESSDELTDSEWFNVLTSARRRDALEVLADHDQPLELDVFATEVAEQSDASGGDDFRRQVKISLHHTHLPMMSDHGIIDYDSDSHRITP